jgi:hypothetical protein
MKADDYVNMFNIAVKPYYKIYRVLPSAWHEYRQKLLHFLNLSEIEEILPSYRVKKHI